jgi:hypothetical protein
MKTITWQRLPGTVLVAPINRPGTSSKPFRNILSTPKTLSPDVLPTTYLPYKVLFFGDGPWRSNASPAKRLSTSYSCPGNRRATSYPLPAFWAKSYPPPTNFLHLVSSASGCSGPSDTGSSQPPTDVLETPYRCHIDPLATSQARPASCASASPPLAAPDHWLPDACDTLQQSPFAHPIRRNGDSYFS